MSELDEDIKIAIASLVGGSISALASYFMFFKKGSEMEYWEPKRKEPIQEPYSKQFSAEKTKQELAYLLVSTPTMAYCVTNPLARGALAGYGIRDISLIYQMSLNCMLYSYAMTEVDMSLRSTELERVKQVEYEQGFMSLC